MESFLANRSVEGDNKNSPEEGPTEGFQSLEASSSSENVEASATETSLQEATIEEGSTAPELTEPTPDAPISNSPEETSQVISNEADDHQVEVVSENGQITKILVHCPGNKEIVINCEY